MHRFEILPRWALQGHPDGEQKLQRLIALLTAIYHDGNLASASRSTHLSYRHAWGIIKDGDRLFGVPLVRMTRGRGAELTALGEKLVWADKRIAARLSPILQSLSSELDAEIHRTIRAATAILRIDGSHGYAIAALRDFLIARGVPVELQFTGSPEALASVGRSNCDLAGFHVPIGDLQSVIVRHYEKWLRPRDQTLIHVVTRRQGIIVAKGNPRGVAAIGDLVMPALRFVNRQPGSGTRMLLDLLLQRNGIDNRDIEGYDRVEFTHDAIAAYIASGLADAGLGVEAGARKLGLDFIPLLSERYFLACHSEALSSPAVQSVLEVLRSPEFKVAIHRLHGLDADVAGTTLSMSEAFGEALG